LGNHKTAQQFVRYAIVGCFNAVLFLAVFNALTPTNVSRVRIIVAYTAGLSITSITSFALNRRWAFQGHRREQVARQYARFLFFTLVGLALQLALFSVLLIPLHELGRIGRNAAAVATAPVSVAWNFTAYRRWTFRPELIPPPG
jgi:putative flippase GtrA